MFQSAFGRHALRPLLRRRGIIVLLGAVRTAALAAPGVLDMRLPDLITPGPGVTRSFQLSAYLPPLAHTPGDTPVYVLDGRDPGGTILVLGGTHGDEIAGYLAAVLLVEQARVFRGRLIVIPRANASGFTHNVPQEGPPQRISIRTSHGIRHFTYGAWVTNPIHMETTDPAQGRLRGRTDEDLVTKGQDRFYVHASELNQLSVPFPPSGWPLDVRVGRHLAGIEEFARSLGELSPEKAVALSGVPEYSSILSNGIGSFLR